MNIHLISVGGSVMHNLAISLHKSGHSISGSDDEIYEPSRSRLCREGLLPKNMGWDVENIHRGLDAIVLGMHARKGNPELAKALSLGIPIYSYPEFIAKLVGDKKRIVIGGSHGKTTTTGIIMRVLQNTGLDFDYLVGAPIQGFSQTVQLSDAPLIVLEGDEYLSSAIDNRPKFLHYKPHLAVITGIAWDHINVFPRFETYLKQFEEFQKTVQPGGVLFYYKYDAHLGQIVSEDEEGYSKVSYNAFRRDAEGRIEWNACTYETMLFGHHNDQNLMAAYLVCSELGIEDRQFFDAVRNFQGASKRLECISANNDVFLDFAHAPSKVKATVDAVKTKHPNRKLTVFLELHTFSSLDKEFIQHYAGSLDPADCATVFCDDRVFSHKKMKKLDPDLIQRAFKFDRLSVIYNPDELYKALFVKKERTDEIVLIMSSGNLGGIDIRALFGE